MVSTRINVLMFPWLAHGHISPFLELAKALLNSKIPKITFHIYFCSTRVNLSSIKPNLPCKYTQDHDHSIEFIELHLPSLPNLLPHLHTTKNLPPHLMPTLKMALDMSSPNFFEILKTLRPDFLIYDFFQPWVSELALSLDIFPIFFLCMGVSFMSFLIHNDKFSDQKDCTSFPFPAIRLHDHELVKFTTQNMSKNPSLDDHQELSDVGRSIQCIQQSYNIVLIKSFKEIEGKYIDYFSSLVNKKIVPVGPLVQEPTYDDQEDYVEIFQWLDKKERSSTVFVSFGTEYFLGKEEMEEIAYGLEQSEVNFIWGVKFFKGEKKVSLEEALPNGFLERVGDRGLVLEKWVPQTRVLEHPSIGGFVSHCGWSSLMESMKLGVPIIAIPMQIDQPFNARLVGEVGVGVEVKRDGNGRLGREEVARVIREVVEEENGESVKMRAIKMSQMVKEKGDEEIANVVDELVKLYQTTKSS